MWQIANTQYRITNNQPIRRHRPLPIVTFLACLVLALTACTSAVQAAWNVLDYRLRRTLPPLLITAKGQSNPLASLAGVVRDAAGRPIPAAIVLVSTPRGQVYQTHSDERGHYRLEGMPAGHYVPLAAAWGYDEATGPLLRLGGNRQQVLDFVLVQHQPSPIQPVGLHIGPARQASSHFPEPMIASRFPFTFTLDGLTINGGQIYLPAKATTPPSATLVIIYPSPALNWDAASVGLTRDGFAVLAVGPDPDRSLDIEGHVRDFRAVLQFWQEGQLEPLPSANDCWVLMSGSFGSLILFRALRDLPMMPAGIVSIGGISDAFLGVQSLYSEELAIPPPYDMAIAALGRPDRDPAFFFAYSPVFFAGHLPSTLLIHMLNDEVIPHNQALALDAALTQAGRPHELLLYHDTTHYLDAYRPTKATYMVYERVLAFARRNCSGAGHFGWPKGSD